MFLKSIELENIRSYKKTKLNFIKGINFLSGDIGSGKSSILQSIEFSLFGLKGSGIDAKDLLRRGEKKASVRVIFKEKEKEIEIFREIKKTPNSISQGVGYIRVDNNIQELTPNELDAKIFEIFNFPMDFLKKNKNLIYRFSIYSAQDELKKILQVEPEKRLEVIRKVFNIDKYKTISDALSIYETKLKGDLKYFMGSLDKIDYNEDKYQEIKKDFELKLKEFEKIKEEKLKFENKKKALQTKKKELEEKKENLQKKLEIINKNLNIINSKKELKLSFERELKNINKAILEFDEENLEKNKSLIKAKLLEIEKKIKEKDKELEKIKELKNNKEKEKDELREKLNEISRLKEKKELNEDLLKKLDPLLIECRIEDFKVKLRKTSKELKKFDTKKEDELKEKLFFLKANIKKLEKEELEISDKIKTIFDLEKCSHCYQKVETEHKEKIKQEFEQKLKEIKEETIKNKEELKNIEKELKEFEEKKDDFEKINNEKIKFELNIKKLEEEFRKEKEEVKRISEKKEALEEKIKELNEKKINQNLENIIKEIQEINKKIDNFHLKEEFEKENKLKLELSKLEETEKNILKSKERKKELELNIEKINKILEKEEDNLNKQKLIEKKKEEIIDLEKKLEEEIKDFEEKYSEFINKYYEISNEVKTLENEIKKLKEKKEEYETLIKKKEKLEELINFIQNKLYKILKDMEKAIFSKYYYTFNEYFEEYFKALIEDEGFDIRLDSSFTPIIEQNGFDLDFKNLSGGEKSSVAISYRLSLKKIIEDYFINNLSLLILDEPTDGFSQEQVRRLGEILSNLKLSQIILVSHDEKIEPISDKMIRIEKINGISKIIEN